MNNPAPISLQHGPISLSIVMPVYNEEAVLETVIQEHVDVIARVQNGLADWEIICLDDGSSDRTGEILDRLSRKERRIRTLRHPQNSGIHASLRDLYQAATGTHVYVTGSDGQWPARNLTLLLKQLRESNADLVVGIRKNRRDVYGLKRMAVSHLFNFLPRVLFGVNTGDAGSNKLGKKELMSTSIVSDSPFAEAERIIKAAIQGSIIRFVDIEFSPRAAGKTTGASWNNIAASLRDVFRCVRAYGLLPLRSA